MMDAAIATSSRTNNTFQDCSTFFITSPRITSSNERGRQKRALLHTGVLLCRTGADNLSPAIFRGRGWIEIEGLLDNRSCRIRQAEMAPLELVAEAQVVDAQTTENRRVHIVDVDGIFGDVV
jgi:hypothetical protein